MLVGRHAGHLACKKLGVGFVGRDDLTGAYSSNCHHHFITSYFNKHRLNQAGSPGKWLLKMERVLIYLMQGISATLVSTVMVHQSCSTVLQTIRYSTYLTLRMHANK